MMKHVNLYGITPLGALMLLFMLPIGASAGKLDGQSEPDDTHKVATCQIMYSPSADSTLPDLIYGTENTVDSGCTYSLTPQDDKALEIGDTVQPGVVYTLQGEYDVPYGTCEAATASLTIDTDTQFVRFNIHSDSDSDIQIIQTAEFNMPIECMSVPDCLCPGYGFVLTPVE